MFGEGLERLEDETASMAEVEFVVVADGISKAVGDVVDVGFGGHCVTLD